jgi:hypothetical protein
VSLPVPHTPVPESIPKSDVLVKKVDVRRNIAIAKERPQGCRPEAVAVRPWEPALKRASHARVQRCDPALFPKKKARLRGRAIPSAASHHAPAMRTRRGNRTGSTTWTHAKEISATPTKRDGIYKIRSARRTPSLTRQIARLHHPHRNRFAAARISGPGKADRPAPLQLAEALLGTKPQAQGMVALWPRPSGLGA